MIMSFNNPTRATCSSRRPVSLFILIAGGILLPLLVLLLPSSVDAFAVLPSLQATSSKALTSTTLTTRTRTAKCMTSRRPLVLYSMTTTTTTTTAATDARNDTSTTSSSTSIAAAAAAAALDSTTSLINDKKEDLLSLSGTVLSELQEWVQHAAADSTSPQQAIAAAVQAEHVYQNKYLHATAAAAAADNNNNNNQDAITTGLNLVLKAWYHCSLQLATARWQEQQHMTTTTTTAAENAASESETKSKNNSNNNNNNNNNMEWVTSAVMQDVTTAGIYTPKDAAERAQQWLTNKFPVTGLSDKKKKKNDADDDTKAADDGATNTSTITIIPNTDSYNIVMKAWAASRDPVAPQHVKDLLQRHPQPNLDTYNAWMEAYAVAPHHPERLVKVKQMYQFLLNSSNNNEKKKNSNNNNNNNNNTLQPNLQTINALLQAYARQANDEPDNSLQYATAATKLFQEQTKQQQQQNLLQPNVQTYNHVMDCWARVAAAGKRRLGSNYDPMLAPRQAEALFQEMQQRSHNEGGASSSSSSSSSLYPDIDSYVTLMKTWARSGTRDSIPRCEALLNELCTSTSSPSSDNKNDHAGQQQHIPPTANTLACNALLHAYARSRRPDKAKCCLQLLQRMRSSSSSMGTACRPNLISYNTAIDACSRTNTNKAPLEQQTAALKIAFAIFQTIQKDKTMTADNATYAGLLRVVAFLMPAGNQERNQIAKSVFEKAVSSGHVDENVLRYLQKAVDSEVFHKLVGGDLWDGRHMHYDKIPSSWNRHAE